MNLSHLVRAALPFVLGSLLAQAGPVNGWLNWRGPRHDSVSAEKGLPTKIDAANPLWATDFPGQSTP